MAFDLLLSWSFIFWPFCSEFLPSPLTLTLPHRASSFSLDSLALFACQDFAQEEGLTEVFHAEFN